MSVRTRSNRVDGRESPVFERLVTEHLGLVDQVVNRVAARFPRHVDRDELRNAGALGLVEAARRYDPSMEVPFDRYATIRIRGAILDSTRSRDWATRLVRRQTRELTEAEATYAAENGKTPEREALATMLGVTPREVADRRARATGSVVLSLDFETPEGASPHEQLAEIAMDVVPDACLEHRETLGTLLEAVAELPGVHGQVVKRHYFNEELLQEIAADLGVTEARVSQIKSEAVAALRRYFGSIYEGVPEVDEDTPGKRTRAAFVERLTASSTWRSRLDAADPARMPAAQRQRALVGV